MDIYKKAHPIPLSSLFARFYFFLLSCLPSQCQAPAGLLRKCLLCPSPSGKHTDEDPCPQSLLCPLRAGASLSLVFSWQELGNFLLPFVSACVRFGCLLLSHLPLRPLWFAGTLQPTCLIPSQPATLPLSDRAWWIPPTQLLARSGSSSRSSASYGVAYVPLGSQGSLVQILVLSARWAKETVW